MQRYTLQITHRSKGLIKLIFLVKENFIRTPTQRKAFEYANANEFSNIIFVHHLKDKTTTSKQNPNLFCRISQSLTFRSEITL